MEAMLEIYTCLFSGVLLVLDFCAIIKNKKGNLENGLSLIAFLMQSYSLILPLVFQEGTYNEVMSRFI